MNIAMNQKCFISVGFRFLEAMLPLLIIIVLVLLSIQTKDVAALEGDVSLLLRERIRQSIQAENTNLVEIDAEGNTEMKSGGFGEHGNTAGYEYEDSPADIADHDDGSTLVSVEAQDGSESKDQIQPQDALLSLQIRSKISFDCYTRMQNTCESQYCSWVNGVCILAPAAYYRLCEFYCETAICLQPNPETPQGTVVCPVRQRAVGTLCSTLKARSNCVVQHGQCQWKTKAKRCVAATTTCCARAQTYCRHKKRRLLWPALNKCRGFAYQWNICSVWRKECLPLPPNP